MIEHPAILEQVRQHSQAMAAANTISHDGFHQRVENIRAADSGIYGYICENVHKASGYSDQESLDRIFNGWMQSDPHRRCMLDEGDARTQSAAVGLVKSGDTWWATFITATDTTP